MNPSDFKYPKGYREIPYPIRRGLIRLRTIRTINHLDIHWRNTPFLVKFMTAASTIKNRHNNGLNRTQQRQVANAIKRSRVLNLLPYTGFIRSHHKLALRDIHSDIELTNLRRVDLETGAIKIVQPSTEWNINSKIEDSSLEKLNKYDET